MFGSSVPLQIWNTFAVLTWYTCTMCMCTMSAVPRQVRKRLRNTHDTVSYVFKWCAALHVWRLVTCLILITCTTHQVYITSPSLELLCHAKSVTFTLLVNPMLWMPSSCPRSIMTTCRRHAFSHVSEWLCIRSLYSWLVLYAQYIINWYVMTLQSKTNARYFNMDRYIYLLHMLQHKTTPEISTKDCFFIE